MKGYEEENTQVRKVGRPRKNHSTTHELVHEEPIHDLEPKESVQNEPEVEKAGAKKEPLSYEVTVTLPSKGLLYKEDGIPADISLRGMTTKEEKILYASQGGSVFKKILRNCVVSPKKLDVNKLVLADEMFLILQLRMVTYGDSYKVSATCPNCGSKNSFTIKLSDFETEYLDDDFTEPVEVELPRSGDTVTVKQLRNEDLEQVHKYSKRNAKQFNQNIREVEYICRLAKYITSINGKPVDFIDAKAYVENMQSMDSRKLQTAISKIQFGVDTLVTVTCPDCGEDFDFIMPLTSEFFRPDIE